jgi:hypothetical protein
VSNLSLVWHQFRYNRRRFRRDPAGLFFAVVFPLIFHRGTFGRFELARLGFERRPAPSGAGSHHRRCRAPHAAPAASLGR